MTRKSRRQRGTTLAAATVGLALGYSTIGYAAFGTFIIPLSEVFGWGRGDISIAFTLMSYTIAILAPLVGLALDRFGVRKVLLPAIATFGLAVGSLAFLSDNIIHFYLAYILLGITGVGTAPPSYARAIVRWFDRRRGLALGVGLAGIGFGTAAIPPYVQYWIAEAGWRAGYLSLAALILGISLPLVWIWLHEPQAGAGQDGEVAPSDVGHFMSQAVRERTFWQMLIGFTILGLFTSGIMSHLVPLLRDRGASPGGAAAAASALGFALIVGRLATGVLLDRFPAHLVVSVCLLGAICGLAMLWWGGSGLALAAVLLMGFAIGAELDFMSYLISRYHGLRSYGRIYGILYGMFIFGSGLGPLVMGYSQQASGDYGIGLAILLAVTLIALVPFALLGRYPVFTQVKAA